MSLLICISEERRGKARKHKGHLCVVLGLGQLLGQASDGDLGSNEQGGGIGEQGAVDGLERSLDKSLATLDRGDF